MFPLTTQRRRTRRGGADDGRPGLNIHARWKTTHHFPTISKNVPIAIWPSGEWGMIQIRADRDQRHLAQLYAITSDCEGLDPKLRRDARVSDIQHYNRAAPFGRTSLTDLPGQNGRVAHVRLRTSKRCTAHQKGAQSTIRLAIQRHPPRHRPQLSLLNESARREGILRNSRITVTVLQHKQVHRIRAKNPLRGSEATMALRRNFTPFNIARPENRQSAERRR